MKLPAPGTFPDMESPMFNAWPYPADSTAADTKLRTYTGGCHTDCGRFELTVRHPNVDDVTAKEEPTDEAVVLNMCQCVTCSGRGYVLMYVPRAFFTIVDRRPSEASKSSPDGPLPLPSRPDFAALPAGLGRFLCNSKRSPHIFCPDCGANFGIDALAVVCVNARVLKLAQPIRGILTRLSIC